MVIHSARNVAALCDAALSFEAFFGVRREKK